MEFGEILYTLRKKHNLSQKELAKELEVAQASINYWEKGERTPSISAAKKIADYFGLSVNDFFHEMIVEKKSELKKETTFYDYLDSLGYEIGQGEHEDYQMHIKKTDTYIELNSEDIELFEKLQNSTETNIRNSIEWLLAAKKH